MTSAPRLHYALGVADRVRVGVVGTSWYAELMHLPNLKSHPGADVVALCGPDEPRLAELAAKFSIPHCFRDWREMISSGMLQALVVVTPHDLHYPITMEALDAGLHVLCEKPLAMTAAQAKAMLDRAESKGLCNMCYFTWRWLPVYRHAVQLIHDGYVGRVFQVEARYLAGYALEGGYHWRADARHSLGALGELGSHIIDLVRLCGGEVSQVSGRLGAFVDKQDAEGRPMTPAFDTALCTLELESAAQASIQISSVAYTAERDQEQHLVVHGEEGTLEVDMIATRGMSIRGARRPGGELRELPVPADLLGPMECSRPVWSQFPGAFQSQPIGTRLFVDSILGGTPAVPGFADGWRAQEVIDAAFESNATGCWVTLPRPAGSG